MPYYNRPYPFGFPVDMWVGPFGYLSFSLMAFNGFHRGPYIVVFFKRFWGANPDMSSRFTQAGFLGNLNSSEKNAQVGFRV